MNSILTLSQVRMIPGTTRKLMQPVLVADLKIDLPKPIVGLASWVNDCLPELNHLLSPYTSIDPAKNLILKTLPIGWLSWELPYNNLLESLLNLERL